MDFKLHLTDSLKKSEENLEKLLKKIEPYSLGTAPVELVVRIQVARDQVNTYKRAIRAYTKMEVFRK